MKILLLLFTLVPTLLHANDKISQCILTYLMPLKMITEKKVGPDGADDKLKHCSLSCMLSIHCLTAEVAVVGVAKEIADIFGPGNAEFEDLQADYKGIAIYTEHKVKKYSECVRLCEIPYPRKINCPLK